MTFVGTTLPPPAPPEPRWRHRFGPWTVVGLAVTGIAFDLAVRRPLDSVAGFLLVAALVALGLWTQRGVGRLIVGSALVPGVFLVVRDTPWLSSLNVLAALGLVAIGSGVRPDTDVLRLGVSDLVRRALRPFGALGLVPRLALDLLDALGLRRRDLIQRLLPGLRGMLIALPFVLVLLLLLAGADAVFASYLTTPFDLDEGFGHLVLIGIGLAGAGSVLAEGSRTDGATVTTRHGILMAPEQLALLGGSALVYAGFLAAQLAAVLGGADYVLEATGLTWAEYARSGFFQLLWAALLTLGILMGTRSFGAELEGLARRATTVLALALVVFTIAAVGISIRRLDLYEAAFGPSMLRLYSTVFAGWLGAVFALVGLDRIGRGLRGRLVAAVAVSALITLVGMNLYNPEQQVASGHLAQFDDAEIDTWYLTFELGSDALPVALADPDTRDQACEAEVHAASGLSWNLSRARALEAQDLVCPRPGA